MHSELDDSCDDGGEHVRVPNPTMMVLGHGYSGYVV